MNVTSLRAAGLAVSSAFSLAAAGCSVDLGQVFSSTDNSSTTTSQGGQGGSGAEGGGGGSSGGTGGTPTTSSSDGGSTTTTTTTTTMTTTTTPTGGPINCDDSLQCQLPGEVCCWNKWGIGPGDYETGECQTAPGNCNTSISQNGVHTLITCQTKDDCPGQELCCGDVQQFQAGGGQNLSYYPEINCRPSCDWPTRILCSGPGDSSCPNGLNCQPSQLLPPGYHICTNN